MTARNVERKALSFLAALESAGRSVRKVVIEGHRIEFELTSSDSDEDEFDKIDMRHGKA